MPSPTKLSTAAKVQAPKAPAVSKLNVARSILPLFQEAIDNDGFKNVKKPLDSTLKGSVKYELPMIMSDGSMTLFATPGGSLFVKSQEKGQPEQWSQVKASTVKKFFAAELKKTRVEVSKPPNADKYAHFDVTAPSTDGVQMIHVIGKHTYLTQRTPSMPEKWYRLETPKPGATWSPK